PAIIGIVERDLREAQRHQLRREQVSVDAAAVALLGPEQGSPQIRLLELVAHLLDPSHKIETGFGRIAEVDPPCQEAVDTEWHAVPDDEPVQPAIKAEGLEPAER